jgi:N-acetylneuraminic acid mutarotase
MRYDPTEDRWEILNDLPWLSIEAGLFVVSDTLFVVGGRLEAVGRYNPDTDSWEARPSLPQPRDEAAMGAGDGAIYVVGGATDSDGAPSAEESVLIYDVPRSTWTSVAGPAAVRRRSAAAAVVGDQLFVVGGFPMASTGSVIPTPSPTVPVLNLPSRSWATVADLPFGRWGMSVAALKGRVHVIGGSVLDDDPARSTHVAFDAEVGGWIEAPDILTPRRNARAVALGGELYVIGGSDRPPEISDGIYRGTVVEVFTSN